MLILAASLSCNNSGNNNVAPVDTIVKDTSVEASENNIIENMPVIKELSTFTSLLTQADLIEILKNPGPFTIFAPSNETFSKLPKGKLDELQTGKKTDLINVLGYHIIAGFIHINELKDGDKLKTMSGTELVVGVKGNQVTINGHNVTIRDLQSSNGMIHIMDGVIFQ